MGPSGKKVVHWGDIALEEVSDPYLLPVSLSLPPDPLAVILNNRAKGPQTKPSETMIPSRPCS